MARVQSSQPRPRGKPPRLAGMVESPPAEPSAPADGAARGGASGASGAPARAAGPRGAAFADLVPAADRARMARERRWALRLDPAQMHGVATEVRMLRQSLRDAFVFGDNSAVRQHAEALRRLLRERAIVPELEQGDGAGDEMLEDGLSADLRRILQRVGLEMGADA